MGETTTTTTTTRTVKTTTTISVNMSYLVPQGILKIVEIIVCIIVFSLIASVRGFLSLLVRASYGEGYYDGPTFAMAVGIIFFLTTLILLILFLFNLVEKVGGAKIWYIIDLILNVLAVLLFFIGFIVLCVYCSYERLRIKNGQTESYTAVIDHLVAALVFALIAVVLYILSIVFAMKSGQSPMISIKA